MTHPGKARLMDPEVQGPPAFLSCLLGKCKTGPLGRKQYENVGAFWGLPLGL